MNSSPSGTSQATCHNLAKPPRRLTADQRAACEMFGSLAGLLAYGDANGTKSFTHPLPRSSEIPAPERMICSQETRTIYAPDMSKYSAI